MDETRRSGSGLSRFLRRGVFLAWLAMLAYGVPEIIAGTGRLWLLTPGVWLMAMPLYFLHFLMLVQIAIATGRTSWPALYLFGVIFGLYETWITKVVWSGYAAGGGFAFGQISPWFGIHETLGLVLFYHAVVSFLLPLAVLTRLYPAWGQVFPAPNWVFGTTWQAQARRWTMLLGLGAITAHNMPEITAYLATWLPFLAVLFGLHLWLRKLGAAQDTAMSAPRIGRFGVGLLLVGLGALYGLAFLFIRPEDIPPMGARAITAAFYPVLALLIWRTRPRLPGPDSAQAYPARQPFAWLLGIFGLGVVLSLLAGVGVGIRPLLAIMAFIAMIPLGAGLFVWLGLWRAIVPRG